MVAALAVAVPLGRYVPIRDESECNRTRTGRRDAERAARRDADDER